MTFVHSQTKSMLRRRRNIRFYFLWYFSIGWRKVVSKSPPLTPPIISSLFYRVFFQKVGGKLSQNPPLSSDRRNMTVKLINVFCIFFDLTLISCLQLSISGFPLSKVLKNSNFVCIIQFYCIFLQKPRE